MYAHKWKWVAGYMMVASVALIGCGDDDGEPERDAAVADAGQDDAQPADAGAMDAQACPVAEELWEDIDLTAFTSLVELEALDVADDVMLAEAATYWELRRTAPGNDIYAVVLSAGDKCADADDTDVCSQEFDDLTSDSGFGPSCPPGQCIQYVAVNRGDTNQVLASHEELVTFLGNIDTPTEAALLAYAHGYGWDASEPEGAAGAVRATADGYELLVTELVSDCLPIVTDRVQLTVSTEGAVEVVRRQVYAASCGACT
jgi:hypothetical protein